MSDALLRLSSDEVRVLTLDSGASAIARDTTRRVLAALLDVAVDTVELYDTPRGKPLLRNDRSMHFSISHSHDVSMIAVTRVAAVGVDVERLRPVQNAEAILRRFFVHEDVDAILADDNRDARFVEAWTRAEARVKARGASIWEAATLDPATTVRAVRAPQGFAASVAVAATAWKLTQYSIRVADIAAS